MSTDMDNKADERVSELYREGATITAPEALNRAVLAEAARAAKSPAVSGRDWFRPLAFAATLVLAVTLLFEMQADLPAPAVYPVTEHEIAEIDEDHGPAPVESPAAMIEADRYNLQTPAAAQPEPVTKRQEKFGASRDLGESRNDAVAESSQRIEAAAEEARKPSQDLADTAARRESVGATLRTAAPASSMESKSLQEHLCEPATSADDWWQCVVRLREAGETEAAAAALLRLREQHPEFTVPE